MVTFCSERVKLSILETKRIYLTGLIKVLMTEAFHSQKMKTVPKAIAQLHLFSDKMKSYINNINLQIN